MEKQIDIRKLDKLKDSVEIVTIENMKKGNSLRKAVKMQDELSAKSGSWDGEKEIRKWREKH